MLSIINVISHISHSSILKSIRSNKTAKENSSQDAPRTDEEAVHSRQTASNYGRRLVVRTRDVFHVIDPIDSDVIVRDFPGTPDNPHDR